MEEGKEGKDKKKETRIRNRSYQIKRSGEPVTVFSVKRDTEAVMHSDSCPFGKGQFPIEELDGFLLRGSETDFRYSVFCNRCRPVYRFDGEVVD